MTETAAIQPILVLLKKCGSKETFSKFIVSIAAAGPTYIEHTMNGLRLLSGDPALFARMYNIESVKDAGALYKKFLLLSTEEVVQFSAYMAGKSLWSGASEFAKEESIKDLTIKFNNYLYHFGKTEIYEEKDDLKLHLKFGSSNVKVSKKDKKYTVTFPNSTVRVYNEHFDCTCTLDFEIQLAIKKRTSIEEIWSQTSFITELLNQNYRFFADLKRAQIPFYDKLNFFALHGMYSGDDVIGVYQIHLHLKDKYGVENPFSDPTIQFVKKLQALSDRFTRDFCYDADGGFFSKQSGDEVTLGWEIKDERYYLISPTSSTLKRFKLMHQLTH